MDLDKLLRLSRRIPSVGILSIKATNSITIPPPMNSFVGRVGYIRCSRHVKIGLIGVGRVNRIGLSTEGG